jgi:hypothetical protein
VGVLREFEKANSLIEIGAVCDPVLFDGPDTAVLLFAPRG